MYENLTQYIENIPGDEHFGEGQVLECLKNGDFVRWLGRLKELDEDER